VDENRLQREEKRQLYLREHLDAYHTIAGCKWHSKLQSLRDCDHDFPRKGSQVYSLNFSKILLSLKRPSFCPLIFEEKITETMLIESILTGELFGIFSVDIITPEDKIKDLIDFPPIFQKVEITSDMVNEQMRNGKFPRTVNTMTFNATEKLFETNLLQFYLRTGLKGKKKTNLGLNKILFLKLLIFTTGWSLFAKNHLHLLYLPLSLTAFPTLTRQI
jgi:hypothetical protein